MSHAAKLVHYLKKHLGLKQFPCGRSCEVCPDVLGRSCLGKLALAYLLLMFASLTAARKQVPQGYIMSCVDGQCENCTVGASMQHNPSLWTTKFAYPKLEPWIGGFKGAEAGTVPGDEGGCE